MKIAIVYWSGTVNTEAMAKEIAVGARGKGASVDLFTAADFEASKAGSYDVLAFGCPAMGAEELEEDEFAPMFEAVEPELSGKKVALFGSYGWGDGEWMRTWQEQVEGDGANMVADGLIVNEEPDEDGLAQCKALGEQLTA